MAAATASVSSERIIFLRVVFADGVQEIDLGLLPLASSLGFRTFKATISERIGVSPRRISLSLVCLSPSPPSAALRERRIAINERTDFFAIAREQYCFVFAALCRARRARRGKRRPRPRRFTDLVEGGRQGESAAASPEIRTPRRRGSPADRSNRDPANDEMAAQVVERMDMRERQPWLRRETASCFAAEHYALPLSPESRAVCAECDAAEEEGRKPEFHCCVRDEIVAGFSRRAPPIARPSKERSRSGRVLVNS